jgi:predicted HTH transcriptional regulator
LELIFQDNRISAASITEKLDISSRTVEKQLANLKEMGVIERAGSRKTGQRKITLDK